MDNLTIVDGADDTAVAAYAERALADALAATRARSRSRCPAARRRSRSSNASPPRRSTGPRSPSGRATTGIVPEDHPASNAGRIRALLEPAGAEVVTLSRWSTCRAFRARLARHGRATGTSPRCSPTPIRAPTIRCAIRRLTPDPLPPEAPFDRITLTMPALLDSDELLFVIRGRRQARAVRSRGARAPTTCRSRACSPPRASR